MMDEPTAADELLALERGLQRARDRASRNGLRLEFGDRDGGASWPGKRWASAHLFDGHNQVAGVAQTYGDEASRQRALSFCADQVYGISSEVEERPNGASGDRHNRTMVRQTSGG